MLLLFNIEPFKPLWTLLNYNSFSNKIFYCDSTATSFRYFVKTQISVDIFFELQLTTQHVRVSFLFLWFGENSMS